MPKSTKRKPSRKGAASPTDPDPSTPRPQPHHLDGWHVLSRLSVGTRVTDVTGITGIVRRVTTAVRNGPLYHVEHPTLGLLLPRYWNEIANVFPVQTERIADLIKRIPRT